MVLTLAIPLRKFYGLEDFITERHLNAMSLMMLATGSIVGYGYLTEVFMAWYGSDELDASVLLIPLVRFLPASDPRVKKTVLTIAKELSEHGLVLRRRPREGGDEAITGEAFAVCSFWLASALAEIGEDREAREQCERLLTAMSPLGLYAEHLDPHTGRHLGNYPHMFTHLALVNSLMHMIRSDTASSAVRSMAQS